MRLLHARLTASQQSCTCIAADFVDDGLKRVAILSVQRLTRVHDVNIDARSLCGLPQLRAEVLRGLHACAGHRHMGVCIWVGG